MYAGIRKDVFLPFLDGRMALETEPVTGGKPPNGAGHSAADALQKPEGLGLPKGAWVDNPLRRVAQSPHFGWRVEGKEIGYRNEGHFWGVTLSIVWVPILPHIGCGSYRDSKGENVFFHFTVVFATDATCKFVPQPEGIIFVVLPKANPSCPENVHFTA